MTGDCKKCTCKGQNTCIFCETDYVPIISESSASVSYVYCPLCRVAWPGWAADSWNSHPHHEGDSLRVEGITVALEVMSEDEENQLVADMDSLPWQPSQSGRRKQNFGPKCNFNRHKLKVGEFDGFPWFGAWVQERVVSRVAGMRGYQTIEQCSLEYSPSSGACITPHIDDCWVWGERVVSVSLLSDSVLTLMPYTGGSERYNLQYYRRTDQSGSMVADSSQSASRAADNSQSGSRVTDNSQSASMVADSGQAASRVADNSQSALRVTDNSQSALRVTDNSQSASMVTGSGQSEPVVVRVPMPRRSVLVLNGEARYDWLHCVLREDIVTRRLCLALREFTPLFLSDGEEADIGAEVTKLAQNFWRRIRVT